MFKRCLRRDPKAKPAWAGQNGVGGWRAGRDDREKRKHARDRGQMAYVEGTERRPGGWRAEQRDVQDEAGGRWQAGNTACWAWWSDLSVGDCSGNVDNARSTLIL